ncbi:hypothetical protein QBC47DRAFT_412763 [Echria macrotheca]|uniref:Uncharacterized protein n=1 Tax=Echria macrotheca TaxID=438768 RepID=A0AAJ0BDD6_9PEZI|nr:hypothetical protein QBC47DRAFT_412763 [Echria macrotheca]
MNTIHNRHSVEYSVHFFSYIMDENARKVEATTPGESSTSPSEVPGDELPPAEVPTSYVEYLARLKDSDPTLGSLHQFFQEKEGRPESQLDILDVIGNRIQRQSGVSSSLAVRAADVDFRIVVFSFQIFREVDRRVLDDICYVFDLDPFFVRACFQGPTPRQELLGRASLGRHVDLFGEDFLTVCTGKIPYDETLFATFAKSKSDGRLDTVVLFAKHHRTLYYRLSARLSGKTSVRQAVQAPQISQRRTISQHYVEELLSWNHSNLASKALEHPVEFITPYIDLHLDGVALTINAWKRGFESSIRASADNEISEEHTYSDIQARVDLLSKSLRGFKHFTALHQQSSSPVCETIINDMQDILDVALNFRDSVRDRIGRRTAILSLEESRKSIQMADSVKTLTQLAFIFTPLNFATSFFGANVQEFGSGQVPIWAFISSVIAIGLTTLCVSLLWSRNRDRYSGFARHHWNVIRALAGFWLRRPLLAGLMLVLAYTRKTRRSRVAILAHVDLFRLAPLEDDESISSLDSDDSFVVSDGPSFWKAFVQNTLQRVKAYTDEQYWEYDRFYKPSIRRRREKAREESGIEIVSRDFVLG